MKKWLLKKISFHYFYVSLKKIFSSFIFIFCVLLPLILLPLVQILMYTIHLSMGKRMKGKSGYIIWNIAFLCSQQIYKYKIFISWYTHFLVVFIPSFSFSLLKQHCYKLFFHIFFFVCFNSFYWMSMKKKRKKNRREKKNLKQVRQKFCVTCRGTGGNEKKEKHFRIDSRVLFFFSFYS